MPLSKGSCQPRDRAPVPRFQHGQGVGLTERENPCQGIRKNKEAPRDYYANAAVWDAVYAVAEQELKEAMDLGYLTGQRPADVLIMRSDDTEGDYFLVTQGKTGQRPRILMRTDAGENSLGRLVKGMSGLHPSTC